MQKILIAFVSLLAAGVAFAAVTTNELGQVVTTTQGSVGITTSVSDPNAAPAPAVVRVPVGASAQVDTNATTTTSGYTPVSGLDFLVGKVGGTNALWVSIDGTGWVKIAQE